LTCLKTALGEKWTLPAQGSHRNCAAKLAVSAQFALEEEEFEDMNPMYTAAAISDDHEDGIDNSKSHKPATESLHADIWDTVTKAGLDAIGQHQVFGDFVELPEGRKALLCHWVCKINRDGARNVQWFNARLVSVGNHQMEGINYQATYAPTARFGHGSLVLKIAAKNNFVIHQMDVRTVVSGVDLEDEIHMHPPPRYFVCSRMGVDATIQDKRLCGRWYSACECLFMA
jgi:hypothetical protein